MTTTLLPRIVGPGDVVAVAALSGGLGAEEVALFESGVRTLESLGFEVRISPLVDLSHRRWWSAATPAELAHEFNTLLLDPEVRAIFALTGGRAVPAYLDLIDFDAVRADPKPVIGFSDISTLLLALHSQTGLVGLHADLLLYEFSSWDSFPHERRAELANTYLRLLAGEPIGLPPSAGAETWRSGVASGPLIGGMLNRLIRIQAGPYALPLDRFDGALLFWEDETPSSVVWMDLQTLRTAGILDRIAGMIVGPTATVDSDEGVTLREVTLDALGGRDIPVLGNADIGHEPPNVPLPLGVVARLDADAKSITVVEPTAR